MTEAGKLGADTDGLFAVAKNCVTSATASESTKKRLEAVLNLLMQATGSPFISAMIAALKTVIKWLETVISSLTKFAEMLKGHATKQKELGDKRMSPPAFELPSLPQQSVKSLPMATPMAEIGSKGDFSYASEEFKGSYGKVELDKITAGYDAKAGASLEEGLYAQVSANANLAAVTWSGEYGTVEAMQAGVHGSATGKLGWDGGEVKLNAGAEVNLVKFDSEEIELINNRYISASVDPKGQFGLGFDATWGAGYTSDFVPYVDSPSFDVTRGPDFSLNPKVEINTDAIYDDSVQFIKEMYNEMPSVGSVGAIDLGWADALTNAVPSPEPDRYFLSPYLNGRIPGGF